VVGKSCRRCGCRLASDHGGEEWCTPCLASRRDYDPRNDPFFLDEVLHYLVLYAPERVELFKVMGLRPEHRQLLKNAVWKLRRRGFDIRAVPRSPGYRFMGMVEISHVCTTDERECGRIQA
jgi:hypothetical protein